MFTIGFLTSLYLLVATFAASMTYFEQQNSRERNILFIVLGYLACAFWPVTLVTVMIAAQRSHT